jgi:hypothetical protein
MSPCREGLDRLRQCRAQHHHHPLQLSAAGQHPLLRMVDEAVGGAGAGPQLQRHGQPARRAEPLSFRRPARRLRPARQRHAAARRRRRTARSRRRARACCRSSISTMRAFRFRAACCSARRHGAARRRRLGLCARRRPARRRHRSELRGDRVSCARAADRRRRDHARPIRRRKVGLAVAGNSRGWRRWPACACRSRAMCCRPSSPRAEAADRPGVVTFGAGHFYVSQSDKGGLVFGGDIDGYNSYAQRGNLPVVEDVCEGGMALMPMIGRLRVLRLGRHHGHVDGRLADHRPTRRSTASISTPAGAMAASRRRRPPAGASPI